VLVSTQPSKNTAEIRSRNDTKEYSVREHAPFLRTALHRIFCGRRVICALVESRGYDDVLATPKTLSSLAERGSNATRPKTEAELREEIEALDATIPRAPREPALYCKRGRLYAELEEFDKAVADCDVAVALLPGSTNFTDRGCVHMAAGNLESAIEDFACAVAADPKSGIAYSNRAAVTVRLANRFRV